MQSVPWFMGKTREPGDTFFNKAVLEKNRLDIKSVRKPISDTFDVQTIFGKKASIFGKKSVLTSKVFGNQFRTLLMSKRFSGKKAS